MENSVFPNRKKYEGGDAKNQPVQVRFQKLHGFPAILCGRDMAIPSRFLRGLSFTPQKQHVKTMRSFVRLQKHHNGMNKGCIVNSDVRAAL